MGLFLHRRHSQNKKDLIYTLIFFFKNKDTFCTKSTIKSVPAALHAERETKGNAAGEGEAAGGERRKGEAEGKGTVAPEFGTGAEAGTSPAIEGGTTAGAESGGRGSEAAAGRGSRLWGAGSCNGEPGEEGGPGGRRGARWVETDRPEEEAGSRTGTAR